MTRLCTCLFLVALATSPWANAAENLLAKPAQQSNRLAPRADDSSLPLVERIVAVVNTDIITLSDLNDRTNLIGQQLAKQNIALPEQSILMRQVLEKIILDTVQKQYAKEVGLKIDDAQLDQAIGRIAEDNKLSAAAFRAAVEKEGVTFNKFREEIRSEMLLAQLREREVDNRVVVTDAEIDAQLQQEKSLGASAQDEYELAHILVTVPENSAPDKVAQLQKKIESAYAQLKKGVDFAEVAASFSEAPDALRGGNLGWRSAARLPSMFAESLAQLKPAEYSGILRSPNGFHIVKLINKRSSDAPAPITQYHARQILIKINPQAPEGEAHNKISSLHARLIGGEDFGRLATLNSEDESRSRNGDLGWVSEGETLPQFEKALKSLKPGTFSAPFETQLGWHIVQLLETRQADATLERRRNAARQGLRARKSDEVFDEWVRQLRDSAYVDIRLEDH